MTTVREILDAARRLPPEERYQLIERLTEELRGDEPPHSGRKADEFKEWLGHILKRAPPSPVLPSSAFDRDQMYDE
jgi:hypothetical protein